MTWRPHYFSLKYNKFTANVKQFQQGGERFPKEICEQRTMLLINCVEFYYNFPGSEQQPPEDPGDISRRPDWSRNLTKVSRSFQPVCIPSRKRLE